jgi:hypothetical protein
MENIHRVNQVVWPVGQEEAIVRVIPAFNAKTPSDKGAMTAFEPPQPQRGNSENQEG